MQVIYELKYVGEFWSVTLPVLRTPTHREDKPYLDYVHFTIFSEDFPELKFLIEVVTSFIENGQVSYDPNSRNWEGILSTLKLAEEQTGNLPLISFGVEVNEKGGLKFTDTSEDREPIQSSINVHFQYNDINLEGIILIEFQVPLFPTVRSEK